MTKHNKKLYIKILIFLCFFVFLTTTIFLKYKTEKIIAPASVNKNTETVTILAGETMTQLLVAPNTFFYNALVQAKNQEQILFDGKNYPGLGFFVTNIGTLHSGNRKNLLYYINGKKATVGVSSYKLKDGDIIDWKLE